jgi:hypothetical protein
MGVTQMVKDNEISASEIKKIHDGELKLGNGIKCFVIEFNDNREPIRLLSGRAVTNAFGLTGRGQGMSRFTASERIALKMTDRLREAIHGPWTFPITPGLPNALGYESWVLPELCNAILDAHEEQPLPKNQQKVALAAKILSRGLAITGITALVDEATGFQYVRDRLALAAILDKYIGKELAIWEKTFKDDYYEQLFKLRGWAYNPKSSRRPILVGKLTIDMVYKRLAPGVLKELKAKAPRNEKGQLDAKLFQVLSQDYGHPKLKEHLSNLTVLMKASSTWPSFYRMLQRALPKYGDTLALPFGDEKDDDE